MAGWTRTENRVIRMAIARKIWTALVLMLLAWPLWAAEPAASGVDLDDLAGYLCAAQQGGAGAGDPLCLVIEPPPDGDALPGARLLSDARPRPWGQVHVIVDVFGFRF